MKNFTLVGLVLTTSLTASAQTIDWKRSGCDKIASKDGTYLVSMPGENDNSWISLKLTACGYMTFTLTGNVGEVSLLTTNTVEGKTADNGMTVLWQGSQVSGEMTSTFMGVVAKDFTPISGQPIFFPFTSKEPPQAYYMTVRVGNKDFSDIIPACACLLP